MPPILFGAAANGQVEMAEFLLYEVAIASVDVTFCIIGALDNDNLAVVQVLMPSGKFYRTGDVRVIAAGKGHVKMIKHLIAASASDSIDHADVAASVLDTSMD
ncbi:hypothetical protein PI124_g6104 [Phytophthora idaei]|nr:hypothetical protein PI125_g5176 [Phytophthora idaei]KAG3150664.1 hypothetical protein PI126_g11386 [Phytophthora idaei]KAG3249228.1 hypothetical protein PI124_g6104 [Phytophthora idaei]